MENVINDWGSSLLSVDTWVGTDNLEDVVPSSAYDEEYEESVWNAIDVEMQQLPKNPLSIPPPLPVRPENHELSESQSSHSSFSGSLTASRDSSESV